MTQSAIENPQSTISNSLDPIRLEIFKHLFAAIAEEMGVVLRKSSYSPNIKERRDFSCAVFDAQGQMIAQAAHIPVHLGAMPLSVQAAVQAFADLAPGDAILLNDPFRGGSHLPDITLVTPVFLPGCEPRPARLRVRRRRGTARRGLPSRGAPELLGFVASRAHHADVGGMTPGSMPVAREIYQEGLIIPPVRLIRAGQVEPGLLDLILANVRTPQERAGDLWAQIAANQRGAERLLELVARYGVGEVSGAMIALLAYTERMTRRLLAGLPDGQYAFTDYLDDDGLGGEPAAITVTVSIHGETATVDFTGSAAQQKGSVNAVYAITLSAVYYVFRCLLGLDVPNNTGCLAPIRVIAPPGSLVNALPPAPVAGGNVETSQRIVDVLLGALAQAAPLRVPAASQGSMNNLSIGGFDAARGAAFAYYETVGGGAGALPTAPGASAVHSHMTNTLNTPAEALEYAYPLRVVCYQVRRGSGGGGRFPGGDGIRRDLQTLVEAQATLLSERRRFAPYGLAGGQPGQMGENVLIRDGIETRLPGKGTFELKAGDILSIRTPGGGGYGETEQPGLSVTAEA
jgi:N-methylhydantoinase B